MASLDVRIDCPPVPQPERLESPTTRRRRMTKSERHKATVKFNFNKTIAGRYRDGSAEYEEVGVLLVTWADDDLYCKSKELVRLEKVLKDSFRYTVETFDIPSERSETALARKIADFAYQYDNPNKMAMIYYGGHAEFMEGKLQLFPNRGSRDKSAFFHDAIHALKLLDADVLLIVDCCYAANAFARHEYGKRKFELMSATPPTRWARAPSEVGSFTKAFTDWLEKLLAECPEGFSTSRLYREVYWRQSDEIKPFMFDQSPWDFGKIWLRPCASKAGDGTDAPTKSINQEDRDPDEKHVTIDLRLHMTKMPDQLVVNQLAKSLQYLPHVRSLEFKQLNAPAAEIKHFFIGMRQALALKPLIWRLRQRLAEKKMQRQGKEIRPGSPAASKLHTRPRDNSLYDWSQSEIQYANGDTEPVRVYRVSPDAPQVDGPDKDPLKHASPADDLVPFPHYHGVSPSSTFDLKKAETHWVGRFFSYRYRFDYNGSKELAFILEFLTFMLVLCVLAVIGVVVWGDERDGAFGIRPLSA